MEASNARYADKLWDMINGVTAFSVAQSTAFAFASQEKEIAGQLAAPYSWDVAMFGIIFYSMLYMFAIRFLHGKHRQLLSGTAAEGDGFGELLETANLIRSGQYMAVAAFALIDIVAIFRFAPFMRSVAGISCSPGALH